MPAPANLGSGLVRVPEGADLQLGIRLEEVSDGVLVTADVIAPLVGECARCLDEFSSSTQVSFQELYAAEPGGSGDDGYLLNGDMLDLEPALRDALVLELPLSPLCDPECAGLCSVCGIRLADAEPGHAHAGDGGVWAVLKNLFPDGETGSETKEQARDEPAGDDGGTGKTTSGGASDPANSKEL